jgi:ectoine hydroxylase-related dioxygenase (phytanoyl-CoA dioxygenase family)
MSKTLQLRKKMMADGYFIAENIVSEKKIESVFEAIFKIYCKYKPATKLLELQKPWHTNLFHEELIKFRKTDPKRFSLLYDAVQTSVSVLELVYDEIIGKYSANLLGTKNTELSVTDGMVRMDSPFDKRNIAGWHQETSYLRNNGLVVWIPLSDITVELGPLQICPKSHLEGVLKVVKNTNLPSSVSTVSIDEIKPENIEKYSIMHVEIKKGDALFFDTNLFHKSGVNTSNRFRLSCQTRYLITTAEDFVPFRVTKTYNKFALELVGRDKLGFPTY